jgi:signal transduction histidine kinase
LAVGETGIELGFDGPERYDPSTLLAELKQNQAGALYGYLAQKIVTRYGGQMTLRDGRLRVNLPVAAASQAAGSSLEQKELRAKTRAYRIFLDQHKRQAKPAELFDQAVDLIDPLAAELLIESEAMQSIINSIPGLEPDIYPWSAILHNLRFFRMLALELRRNRPLIPAPVNLKSLLESVKPLVAHRVIDHEIVIESDADRPVINSDQTRLLQIFVNLALNALEAMPEQGTLKFRISSGDHYTVEVIDTGRGIAWEILPHLFDPHVTTKGSGRGVGLYNVKVFVQQLNGQIDITSRIGQGTTVTVKLPPSWEVGYF